MTARVSKHTYPISGRSYFVVRCVPCRQRINAGHNYVERASAERAASRHNADLHDGKS